MLRTALVAALLLLVAAVPASASAARPTCAALRGGDYGMFSRAGDRAVGRVVASVSPRCRHGRLPEETALARVRRGLARVARTHDEVEDSAVLEAVADALERARAVREIDALDELLPEG